MRDLFGYAAVSGEEQLGDVGGFGVEVIWVAADGQRKGDRVFSG